MRALLAFAVLGASVATAVPQYQEPEIPAPGTPITEITDARDHMPGAPESSGPYTYGIYGITGMVPAIYDPTAPAAFLAEIHYDPHVYYAPDFLIHYQGLDLVSGVEYVPRRTIQADQIASGMTVATVATVAFPEPSSIVLALGGMMLLAVYRVRCARP